MTPRRRQIPVIVAGAAFVAMVMAACSIPSRPVWWPHQATKTTGTSVTTVRSPWHRGMRQLGIQVYWTANRTDSSDAVVRAKARRIIDYAIALNANSIAVTFPFYTYGITSNTVFARPNITPSARHIAIFLAVAAKAHIRVTLRPELNEHVLIARNPLAWRGSIEPRSRAAWFVSYRRLLLPYVAAARAGHAATFVVGTELNSLEGAPQWRGLIRSLRSVYGGQLAYDENQDDFAANAQNLPVRSHGVDAYPQLGVPNNASVARLTKSWDGWLGTHPLPVRRALTLSEIGLAAVAGSFQQPWAWWHATTTARTDTRIQTAWFRAVCSAVSAERVGGGIYWWEVNFDASRGDPRPFQSDRLTFLDRPAQQVIRSCFAKLSSGGGEPRLTRR